MKKIIIVTVLGAGNMGTTLANIMAHNGYVVRLWNYEGDPDPLVQIREYGENKKYVPGVKLSSHIIPEPILEKALENAEVIFLAVPSGIMMSLVERIVSLSFLRSLSSVFVDISKGFREFDFDKKIKIPNSVAKIFKDMVIISGPAVATDLIKGGFTAMNIAARNSENIKYVKKVLENDFVKLVPTNDVVGMKLCGAMKNVYAILLGMCDGLGFTLNTKSFFVTLAIEEMGRLCIALGGKTVSVMSLSGLGDLIGTGLSVASRNRRFGELLICSTSKEDAEHEVGQVVEGIRACGMARTLARKNRVSAPLLELIYRITWLKKNPQTNIDAFLKKFHH